MNLFALSLYGSINAAMLLYYLRSKQTIFHFPFWAAVIAMGWFFPQAIGGYLNLHEFPASSYADGLMFASMCTLALWGGYVAAFHRYAPKPCWLDYKFDLKRLYWASAALCVFGFYFQWKLFALPDELKQVTQWSGVTVKYLFLSSVFRFGFIALWLLYLTERKAWSPRLLILIVPGLLLLFKAAVIDGRREGMMNFAAYLLIGMWFGRGITIPRWALAVGVGFGLIFINAIGIYRDIIFDGDMTVPEKITAAVNADYSSQSEDILEESGAEFKNFIYHQQVYRDTDEYDFGLIHWNKLVFNYVPAQIVGRELKNAMMYPLLNVTEKTQQMYGYKYLRGSTSTGYKDSFGSFGWFGFIKFLLIGVMMGTLYRHALGMNLLAQILYLTMLATGMLAVTHSTDRILVADWIYFFALGFPAFYWARLPLQPAMPTPEAEEYEAWSSSEQRPEINR